MAFDMSKYVQYLEDWQVLICLHEDCKYCLKSNGVERHFRRTHGDIYDLHTRQEIRQYAATSTLCQPLDIVVPRNTPPPIPGLKVWNGWQCKQCFKVGPVADRGKDHCENEHGWKSGQGENRS
jgi:hypothetical protein